MILDVPIPWGNTVYYLPLEMIIPIIGLVFTTVWFWRKSRIAKQIHTWVLKLHRSGSAEVYKPGRELDTAIEYTDKDGNSQRPFKPNYQYVQASELKIGLDVNTPDGIAKIIEMVRDPDTEQLTEIVVDLPGGSVHKYSPGMVQLISKKKTEKMGSVSAISPVGWNERIMVHGEGLDELFDWSKVWDNMTDITTEEGGAARLLKESADIFASLKERIKASFRELWWVYIMLAVMSLLGGIIIGGKYVHIN